MRLAFLPLLALASCVSIDRPPSAPRVAYAWVTFNAEGVVDRGAEHPVARSERIGQRHGRFEQRRAVERIGAVHGLQFGQDRGGGRCLRAAGHASAATNSDIIRPMAVSPSPTANYVHPQWCAAVANGDIH